MRYFYAVLSTILLISIYNVSRAQTTHWPDLDAGVITTVAGSGIAGYSGDSGPALDASLKGPLTLTTDIDGNIYFVDNSNYAIRRIDAISGEISTVAGGNGTDTYSGEGGLATDAVFQALGDIKIDASGVLYAVTKYRIVKIDPDTKNIHTVIGDGTSGVSNDGELASNAQLDEYRTSLDLDADGNIYFTQFSGSSIRKIDASTGVLSTVLDHSINIDVFGLDQIAIGSDGYLYASVYYYSNGQPQKKVIKFDLATKETLLKIGNGVSYHDGTIDEVSFSDIDDLVIGPDNDIYIIDSDEHVIRKFNTEDSVTFTIAGTGTNSFSGDGGQAVEADFSSPRSITFDNQGNLFIADYWNYRIRMMKQGEDHYVSLNLSDKSIDEADFKLEGTSSTGLGITYSSSDPSIASISDTTVSINAVGTTFISALTESNTTYAKIRTVKQLKINGFPLTVAGNNRIEDYGQGHTAIGYTISGFVDGEDESIMLSLPEATSSVTSTSEGWSYIEVSGASVTNEKYELFQKKGNVYVKPRPGYFNKFIGNFAGADLDGQSVRWANMTFPKDIKQDADNNLYIFDYGSSSYNRLIKVDGATGEMTTLAGNSTTTTSGDDGLAKDAGLGYGDGIAVDDEGNVYIADRSTHVIRKIDAITGIITRIAGSGSYGQTGDNGPALSAQLAHPYNLTIYDSGLYFTQLYGDPVRRIDLETGVITRVAGTGTRQAVTEGALATESSFEAVKGIAFDSQGNMFLSDPTANQIYKVDAITQRISIFAGTGEAASTGDFGLASEAAVNGPTKLTIDHEDRLYFIEPNSNKVRMIDLATQIVSTVAGNGTSGYPWESIPANSAIPEPFSVSVDSQGQVYIGSSRAVWTVSPKQAQTVTFDPISSLTYGEAPITLSASSNQGLPITYFSSSPEIASISGDTLTIHKAGTVTLSAVQMNDESFEMAHAQQTITIQKVPLTVKVDDLEVPYGTGHDANFTFSYTGFVNGDDASDITETPIVASDVTPTSIAGESFTLSASGGSSDKYELTTYETGTLTVVPAPLTVVADAKSKVYGEAVPELTYTISGYVNGENSSILTELPEATTTATSTSPTGSYPISISGGLADNYLLNHTPASLAVEKAPLTIEAISVSREYGQENPSFSYTYTGFVNSEDESVFTSALTASTSATITSSTGQYEIVPGGATADNYDISFEYGVLSVEPALLTVTAENHSRLYGEENPEFTITIFGFVNNETTDVLTNQPIVTTTATPMSSAGIYDLQVEGGNADNYIFDYFTGTLTIEKTPLTITADDKSKTYGEENPLLTYTAAGFVNNEDVSDLDVIPSVSTLATTISDAGTYDIKVDGASDANYAISFMDGSLTINQASLTITADDKSKTYGDANPSLTYTATGFVNNEDVSDLDVTPSVNTLATTDTGAGTYDITVDGASDANYAISFVDGSLTINQASLTITADHKFKTYGDANPPMTYTATGFVNNDEISDLEVMPSVNTLATTTSDAGTYDISVDGALDANYAISFVDGSLTINQAPLTITADHKAKTYGDANPLLTYTATGFVNNDEILDLEVMPSVNTLATTTSDAGTYGISVDGASDANYAISYVNGSLTINQAPLTITADHKAKTYGDANPLLTYTATGFVNNDEVSDLEVMPSVNTLATTDTGAGTYDITVDGASDANYAISFVDGSLTINQAPLTITADHKAKTYGDVNPLLTYTATGFVNNDDLSALSVSPTLTSTADEYSAVGTYEIVLNGGSAENYTLNYSHGTLTVSKADLIISAIDKTITYGDELPALEYTLSGLKNGDEDIFIISPVISTTASATSKAGSYAISVTDGSAENYRLLYNDATLTINKANLLISADSKQRNYGENNPELTLTYSGFVHNEDASVLNSQPVLTTIANHKSDAGNYSIEVSGGRSENYAITNEAGVLTVNKAMLKVTALNAERMVGESNPTFELQFENFKNDEDITVLDVMPQISTLADVNSPAGEYKISVNGGVDNNYDFEYMDGILSVRQILASEKETNHTIQVYPNPVDKVLKIQVDAPASITLKDLNGRSIYEFESSLQSRIDVSELEEGIYLLIVETAYGQNVFKVLKR